MKKIFIVSFLLLPQFTCIASESEEKTDLTKMLGLSHKVERSPETGDIVFYPAQYRNLENLKKEYLQKEYVTVLLTKRLTMLADFKKLLKKNSGSKEQSNYDSQKALFDSNEIALRENAVQGSLDPISFYEDYSNYENLTTHALEVANLLKERLQESLQDEPEEKKQEKTKSLIVKVSGFIEQNTKRQVEDGQQIDQEKAEFTIQELPYKLQKIGSGDSIQAIAPLRGNVRQCSGEYKVTSASPHPSQEEHAVQ